MNVGTLVTIGRNRIRFPYKGNITFEDLWTLPVKELDTIYKALRLVQKQQGEESLLNTKSAENTVIDAQIEVVKFVVETKMQEVAEKTEAAKNKQKKEKIMQILEEKEDGQLAAKSPEELRKMLEEL